jgi:thioredoxin 1
MAGETTVVNVSDADFEEVVLKSDLPVVVDFWAPWCGPCRIIKPFLPKLQADFAGRLKVVAYHCDEAGGLYADRFGIKSIPSLLFFKDGQVFKTQVGAAPYQQLKQVFAEAVDCVDGGSTAGGAAAETLSAAEEAFVAAIEEAARKRNAVIAPAKALFDAHANPIMTQIWQPYVDAVEKHQRGEIDAAALKSEYERFKRAYDEKLGDARAAYDAVRLPAEQAYDAAIAAAIAAYRQALQTEQQP